MIRHHIRGDSPSGGAIILQVYDLGAQGEYFLAAG
jgi:hypothetical protein